MRLRIFTVMAVLTLLASAAATQTGNRRKPYRATVAETRFVDAGSVRFAYRTVGRANGNVPLVLLNRFRGTMDHWDPALLEILSKDRRVIIFDNVGMARTNGTTPQTLAGFANGAADFIQALGLKKIDVLGFSMGGHVAQQVVLDHPDLVRRVIIAGSTPGFVENIAPTPQKVWSVALKPVNDDEDFLYLFFKDSPTSRGAARDYFARLRLRKDAFAEQVGPEAFKSQLTASSAISKPEASLLPRLRTVTHPVLVANGSDDIMAPTYASWAMAQALPNAKLIVYPDSGHGFLFQHAEEFGRDVLEFLR